MTNKASPGVLYFLKFIFLFFLIFTLYPSDKVEAATNYFIVEEDNIEVYHNINGVLTVVGRLDKDIEYKVVQEQSNWYLIDFGYKLGYVKKSQTKSSNGNKIIKPEKKLPSNPREITLLQNATVYYTSPGKYVPIAQLEKGTTYPVVTSQKNWWGINVGGWFVFVHKNTATPTFLASDRYFEVNQENALVYHNKGGQMVVVGELQVGQQYRRAGGRTDWHLIEFGEQKGHIKKSVTEPSDGSSIKNPARKQDGKKTVYITQDTLVYDNSSGKFIPFASISSGNRYPLVVSQGNWWGINIAGRFGFIPKSSGSLKEIIINYTHYDYTFSRMVDIQMNSSPKSDGAGLIPATRNEVEYYANPLNFPSGTHEYFQFIDLSKPVGLDSREINEKVLKNKGSLSGQASAFIKAGQEYGINEAYLIAHALHETGNGASALSTGIPVDKNGKVTRDSKGNIVENKNTAHIVYNMYGYGAYDSCPIDCGAKYAFDHGWFTLSASIIGGAKSIYNYIVRGQDTLYKMRWNPENPGTLQYATHVAWATAQTRRIFDIYSMIDNYTLYVDVPVFKDQPSNEVNKSGVTNTPQSTLNIRSGPGTDYARIGSIPDNSLVQIIGSSNGWYKINYNGTIGWVSADYVTLN